VNVNVNVDATHFVCLSQDFICINILPLAQPILNLHYRPFCNQCFHCLIYAFIYPTYLSPWPTYPHIAFCFFR